MKQSQVWFPVRKILKRKIQQVEAWVKAWTKPASDNLILTGVTDLRKSKAELLVENALLRQQLIVLKRQVQQPKLRARGRALLVLLASRLPY